MKDTIFNRPLAPWSGAFFSAKYFLWRALALGVLIGRFVVMRRFRKALP